MQVLQHLWTGGPAPWPYIELILCRDVYACTPSELEQQDPRKILEHLLLIGEENRVNKIKQQRR